MAMIGPTSSRAASMAARNGDLPMLQVALDVLHHHDGVVHHQSDREHDRQQGQQVDGEAGDQHQEHRADQRNRNRDDRDQHRAERAEEQEDDDDDDEQRFGQRVSTSLIAS